MAIRHGVLVGLLQVTVNLLRDVGHPLRDVGRFLRDVAGLLLDVEDLPSNVGRLHRQSGEKCLLSKVVNLVKEELIHHLCRLHGGLRGAVCTDDGCGQGRARSFPSA